MQTAEEDPVVSHQPMDVALETLMDYAGPNFRKQSAAWSAALPNDTPWVHFPIISPPPPRPHGTKDIPSLHYNYTQKMY